MKQAKLPKRHPKHPDIKTFLRPFTDEEDLPILISAFNQP
jgi:hypothetical protein